MPYKDLREFLDFLRQKGELKVCQKEVDTRIEIAKVTDKSSKVGGPAILFNNVKGFKTPVVTGLFGTVDRSFLAIDSNKYDGFKKLARGLDKPIPTKIVSDGPCKEVIKKGKDINLHEIPALFHQEKDSHYFITAVNCRVKDPYTGIGNSSINRVAIQDKDKLTVQTNAPHQLGLITRKWLEQGKACPVAIAVGTDPAVLAGSSCGIPFGMDEFEFAGGVKGEPVEVVKCETIDLEVPATSELVIEGEMIPGDEDGYAGKTEYANEAPFAEVHGYFGAQGRSPVIHVTAITHRKDYIYHGLGTAEPPSEHQILGALGVHAEVFKTLKTIIPAEDIVAISPLLTAGTWGAVVSIKKRYPAQAKQLIYTLFSSASFKRAIIVDGDIDVFNPVDVDWAVSFRASADDYIITSELPAAELDPMVTTPPNLMKKVGIDATLPLNGDKKGKVEILCDLGTARYADLDKVNLEDYLGE